MKIETQKGQVFETRVDYPLGDPKNPISWEQVQEKFLNLTIPHLGKEKAKKFADMVNDIEHVECPYRPENDCWKQGRLQQRQGDMAKLRKFAGAVHLRRLVQLLRDALKRPQRNNHHKREAEPDVGDDTRCEGGARLRKPIDDGQIKPSRQPSVDASHKLVHGAEQRPEDESALAHAGGPRGTRRWDGGDDCGGEHGKERCAVFGLRSEEHTSELQSH